MKKLLLATAATALCASVASAEDVKLGILIGFTGPIESLTGHMANAAEAAMAEVNASGKALNGWTFTSVRGDSTCVDAAAAQTAAEKMVTSDSVKGIIGGDCSGVTGAVLQNVARPNGIVMVSPSASISTFCRIGIVARFPTTLVTLESPLKKWFRLTLNFMMGSELSSEGVSGNPAMPTPGRLTI
jgi:ABC-type branched-subunit amino acid transport system substrate-binding protein